MIYEYQIIHVQKNDCSVNFVPKRSPIKFEYGSENRSKLSSACIARPAQQVTANQFLNFEIYLSAFCTVRIQSHI